MSGPHGLSGRDKAGVILTDPSASYWIKAALRLALERDPVDAANDAAVLADILDEISSEAIDSMLGVRR